MNFKVSIFGKLYVTLVSIECLCLVAVCGLSVLFSDEEEGKKNEIFNISVACIFATLGFLFFALDSILLENIFQFWASICVHVLITAYVVWHYFGGSIGRVFEQMSLYLMIGVATCQIVYLVMAPFVQGAFGWRLYKRVGGNVALQEIYRTSQVFLFAIEIGFVDVRSAHHLGEFLFVRPH